MLCTSQAQALRALRHRGQQEARQARAEDGRICLSNYTAERACGRSVSEHGPGCSPAPTATAPAPRRDLAAQASAFAIRTRPTGRVPRRMVTSCLCRSPHLLARWRTFVGLTVAPARPAFGRLPFPFPGPGFQPCRLLLGFRELPLAPFETVVRLSGQYTLSAMFGWGGHSPPRHGASRRERGSRQTSCRPGQARPRRKPYALRST